jgi:hypothetical protein
MEGEEHNPDRKKITAGSLLSELTVEHSPS